MNDFHSAARQIERCLRSHGPLNSFQIYETTGLSLGVVLGTVASLHSAGTVVLANTSPVNYYTTVGVDSEV